MIFFATNLSELVLYCWYRFEYVKIVVKMAHTGMVGWPNQNLSDELEEVVGSMR